MKYPTNLNNYTKEYTLNILASSPCAIANTNEYILIQTKDEPLKVLKTGPCNQLTFEFNIEDAGSLTFTHVPPFLTLVDFFREMTIDMAWQWLRTLRDLTPDQIEFLDKAKDKSKFVWIVAHAAIALENETILDDNPGLN